MRNVSSYGHDGVILAFSVQDVPSCGQDGKCGCGHKEGLCFSNVEVHTIKLSSLSNCLTWTLEYREVVCFWGTCIF